MILQDIYMTPLHVAVRDGNNDKVLGLLEEGADSCIQERGGRTPYAVAMDKGTHNGLCS
jgi:ankyrin repeat protein